MAAAQTTRNRTPASNTATWRDVTPAEIVRSDGKAGRRSEPDRVPARMSFPWMLSLEQVQEILNLGMPSIFALVKSGELRAPQFGGRNVWRVREDDLAAYIDAAYAKTAESIASGQLPEGDTPIDG